MHCDLEVLRQAVRLLRDGTDADDIPKGTAAEARPQSWLHSVLIQKRPKVVEEKSLLRCDGKKHMGVKGHLNCLRVLGLAKFENQHDFFSLWPKRLPG